MDSQRYAIHEAGHAVTALALGARLGIVSVMRSGAFGTGWTTWTWPGPWSLLDDAAATLAGAVSEWAGGWDVRALDRAALHDLGSDGDAVIALNDQAGGNLIGTALTRSFDLVISNQDMINDLACRLTDPANRGWLPGPMVAAWWDSARPQPRSPDTALSPAPTRTPPHSDVRVPAAGCPGFGVA